MILPVVKKIANVWPIDSAKVWHLLAVSLKQRDWTRLGYLMLLIFLVLKSYKLAQNIQLSLGYSYAGKLEESDLQTLIIPAYNNFHDLACDITDAKHCLKTFIVKYCKTTNVPNPSTNTDDYGMNTYGTYGLSMTLKDNKNIKYLFCVKTGKAYVSESKCNALVFSLVSIFAFQTYRMISDYLTKNHLHMSMFSCLHQKVQHNSVKCIPKKQKIPKIIFFDLRSLYLQVQFFWLGIHVQSYCM